MVKVKVAALAAVLATSTVAIPVGNDTSPTDSGKIHDNDLQDLRNQSSHFWYPCMGTNPDSRLQCKAQNLDENKNKKVKWWCIVFPSSCVFKHAADVEVDTKEVAVENITATISNNTTTLDARDVEADTKLYLPWFCYTEFSDHHSCKGPGKTKEEVDEIRSHIQRTSEAYRKGHAESAPAYCDTYIDAVEWVECRDHLREKMGLWKPEKREVKPWYCAYPSWDMLDFCDDENWDLEKREEEPAKKDKELEYWFCPGTMECRDLHFCPPGMEEKQLCPGGRQTFDRNVRGLTGWGAMFPYKRSQPATDDYGEILDPADFIPGLVHGTRDDPAYSEWSILPSRQRSPSYEPPPAVNINEITAESDHATSWLSDAFPDGVPSYKMDSLPEFQEEPQHLASDKIVSNQTSQEIDIMVNHIPAEDLSESMSIDTESDEVDLQPSQQTSYPPQLQTEQNLAYEATPIDPSTGVAQEKCVREALRSPPASTTKIEIVHETSPILATIDEALQSPSEAYRTTPLVCRIKIINQHFKFKKHYADRIIGAHYPRLQRLQLETRTNIEFDSNLPGEMSSCYVRGTAAAIAKAKAELFKMQNALVVRDAKQSKEAMRRPIHLKLPSKKADIKSKRTTGKQRGASGMTNDKLTSASVSTSSANIETSTPSPSVSRQTHEAVVSQSPKHPAQKPISTIPSTQQPVPLPKRSYEVVQLSSNESSDSDSDSDSSHGRTSLVGRVSKPQSLVAGQTPQYFTSRRTNRSVFQLPADAEVVNVERGKESEQEDEVSSLPPGPISKMQAKHVESAVQKAYDHKLTPSGGRVSLEEFEAILSERAADAGRLKHRINVLEFILHYVGIDDTSIERIEAGVGGKKWEPVVKEVLGYERRGDAERGRPLEKKRKR